LKLAGNVCSVHCASVGLLFKIKTVQDRAIVTVFTAER